MPCLLLVNRTKYSDQYVYRTQNLTLVLLISYEQLNSTSSHWKLGHYVGKLIQKTLRRMP